MSIRILALVAAAALTVSSAHAAVFTQAATVSRSGAPDYTLAYLDFAGFNPSLGTLNGITIQGRISVQETLNYQFSSSTSSMVPVTLSFSLGVSGQPYVYVSQDTTGSATYPASGGEVVRVSGSALLTDVLSDAFVSSQANGAGFAGQIGTSVTSPRFVTSANGVVNASATAFYDYTPTSVPEPASLALLGMAAVVPLLRRRKAQ